MLLMALMASPACRGQALPEYLLILAALVILALSGVRLYRSSLQSVEQGYAVQFMLPSP